MAAEQAAFKDRRAERDGIARVAVAVFGDDDVIADQQIRDHRSGRDRERLEQQDAQHQRDQQRIDDRLDDFEQLIGCAAGLCLVAHRFVFLISEGAHASDNSGDPGDAGKVRQWPVARRSRA